MELSVLPWGYPQIIQVEHVSIETYGFGGPTILLHAKTNTDSDVCLQDPQ